MANSKQGYPSAIDPEGPPSYEDVMIEAPRTTIRPSFSNPGVKRQLPIVIPQTSKSFRGAFFSPFSRAYCSDLESYSITPSEFLFFLDGLNEAFIAHPAFQIASHVGTLMSFTPLHPVMFAGMGLSVGSGLVSAATSWKRAKIYVQTANEEIFLPKGLKCTVLKTKKMMMHVGHNTEKLELPPLDMLGERDESVGGKDDPRMRRLLALGDRVAPLTFENLPDPEPMDNWWKRMGSKEAQRKDTKMHKKLMKERRKGLEDYEKSMKDVDKETRKYDKELDKIERERAKEIAKADKKLSKRKAQDPEERAKIEEDLFHELKKIDKDMNKTLKEKDKEIRKETKEGEKKFQEADNKEQRMTQKIYWIVIDQAAKFEKEGLNDVDVEGTGEAEDN